MAEPAAPTADPVAPTINGELALLIEQFDLAIRTPDDVAQLKQLILQLAVMGMLVPNDPHDIDVSASLLPVTAVGKMKSSNGQSGLESVQEVTYGNWCQCKLGQAMTLVNGRAYKRAELLDQGTPIIRIQNLNGGDSWYYSDLELPEEKYCDSGDLLFAWSASFGPYIWEGGRAIFHYHIWRIELAPAIEKRFAFHLLDYLTDRAKAQAHGLTMLHITKTRMENLVIWLPPLAEQHRIVAKVDELMAAADELSGRLAAAGSQRQRFHTAALHQLTAAESPARADAAWSLLDGRFDALYDDPAAVDELKQAILQLAVMGRLVPQDPDDEPAAVLLERIGEERKSAILSRDLRKQKSPSSSVAIGRIIELPPTWEWCKFDDIAAVRAHALKAGPFGSSLKKADYSPSGYKIYGQEQVINEDPYYGDYFIDAEKFASLKSNEVAAGDILVSLVGTIGKVLILPPDIQPGIINPRLVKLSLDEQVSREYIRLYLYSPSTREMLFGSAHGGTMNILNLSILRRVPIALPPCAEQHRIVAKVDELFALADEVAARAGAAEVARGRLLAALVGRGVG